MGTTLLSLQPPVPLSQELPNDATLESIRLQMQEAVRNKTPASVHVYEEALDFVFVGVRDLLVSHENIYKLDQSVENITVFGDTHGSVDLATILDGITPSQEKNLVFMGDYVDRGEFSLENIILILLLKIEYPNWVHVLRGNHEDSETCGPRAPYGSRGFWNEFKRKVPMGAMVLLWNRMMDIFATMPLACIINNVLYVHAAPPMDITGEIVGPEEMNTLSRTLYKTIPRFPNTRLLRALNQMLWGDPAATRGHCSRGGGIQTFGPENTKSCLLKYGVTRIIRAHEAQPNGWTINHQDDAGNPICLTVFSASDYCGIRNRGALALVDAHGGIDMMTYASVTDISGNTVTTESVTPRDVGHLC